MLISMIILDESALVSWILDIAWEKNQYIALNHLISV